MIKYIVIILLLFDSQKNCAAERVIVSDLSFSLYSLISSAFITFSSKQTSDVVDIPKNFIDFSHNVDQGMSNESMALLSKATPSHLRECIEKTQECKRLYPFAPEQRIFLWCLSQSYPRVSVRSFIPSLNELSSHGLAPITEVLQSLPSFFTYAAFKQINDGYLEGATSVHDKWKNAAAVCRAVTHETSLMVDAGERFEVASRLMLFMQYRSVDLVPYYVDALLDDIKNIEYHYHPFYCLSRRLKGQDHLQDKLLRKLKTYGESTTGLDATLSSAKKLSKAIKREKRDTVVEFIENMIDADLPSVAFLALPE